MAGTPPDPSTYEPRYVSLVEVPLTGPDSFDEPQKRRAIRNAESRLEADANEGESFDSPEAIHAYAVAALASAILFAGPKHPSSVTLGDTADDGTRRTSLAEWCYDQYEDARDSLTASAGDESEGGGGADTRGLRTAIARSRGAREVENAETSK